MSQYVISGNGLPADDDGHEYQLRKGGVKIHGGTWISCVNHFQSVAKRRDVCYFAPRPYPRVSTGEALFRTDEAP